MPVAATCSLHVSLCLTNQHKQSLLPSTLVSSVISANRENTVKVAPQPIIICICLITTTANPTSTQSKHLSTAPAPLRSKTRGQPIHGAVCAMASLLRTTHTTHELSYSIFKLGYYFFIISTAFQYHTNTFKAILTNY